LTWHPGTPTKLAASRGGIKYPTYDPRILLHAGVSFPDAWMICDSLCPLRYVASDPSSALMTLKTAISAAFAWTQDPACHPIACPWAACTPLLLWMQQPSPGDNDVWDKTFQDRVVMSQISRKQGKMWSRRTPYPVSFLSFPLPSIITVASCLFYYSSPIVALCLFGP